MLVNMAPTVATRGARFPGRYIQAPGSIVARPACRAGEILHNKPMRISVAMVVAALKTLIEKRRCL